jgi:GNAT superfamily N-acetyltransferase
VSLAGLLGARDLPDRVEVSAVETARFATTIGRIEVGPDSRCSAVDVLDLVAAAEPDVVVLRYPADRVAWPAAFARGVRTVYHADSIVYWEYGLAAPVELAPGTTTRVATVEERELVHDLARSAFADYGSHYRANPRFSPTDIALGYAEWAAHQVDQPGSAVLIVSEQGSDVAFGAVELDGNRSEITLSGVPQGSRGRGAYRASMAAAEQLSRERGCESIVISTQVHNTVVQRVWARRGYLPVHAFETAHFVRSGILGEPEDDRR